MLSYENKRFVEQEIERLEQEPLCRQNVDRLVALYAVHQHAASVHNDAHEQLTLEQAQAWATHMKPYGAKWTPEQIRQVAKAIGMPSDGHEFAAFYAAMHIVYNDYADVAKKHGITSAEFFGEMAKAFLMDADAKDGKIERYQREIAIDHM